MHVNEANLTNLTGLWKKYGSRAVNGSALPLLHANTHWPHRFWFDWSPNDISYAMPGHSSDATWLENIPEPAVFSLWPPLSSMMSTKEIEEDAPLVQPSIERQLLDNRWVCSFEQKAMYMDLQHQAIRSPISRPGFQVVPVRTREDIKRWVDVGSDAFAYRIDRPVIENLLNDKDIRMLLGYQGGRAAASALLYKTGDIIGIHQVGVKQAFQGQGIARCLMHEIMAACELWRGRFIVLQASQAGQPLYESLGFRAQFTIKNYQRV